MNNNESIIDMTYAPHIVFTPNQNQQSNQQSNSINNIESNIFSNIDILGSFCNFLKKYLPNNKSSDEVLNV